MCKGNCLGSIKLIIEMEGFNSGDFIIKQGEQSSEMYFLYKGQASVIIDGVVQGHKLHEGSYFGEIGILNSIRRTASIQADIWCDVLVLKKSDFDKVLKEFPAHREIISKTGEQVMQKM